MNLTINKLPIYIIVFYKFYDELSTYLLIK